MRSVAPEERVFLKVGNLGLAYSVPAGMQDPTSDPRVLPFLQQIGRYLLDRLTRDPRTAQAGHADIGALKAFAEELVLELEAPFSAELDCEPLHENARQGRRHGDKYSRVATA
jgi:hypothetical protein